MGAKQQVGGDGTETQLELEVAEGLSVPEQTWGCRALAKRTGKKGGEEHLRNHLGCEKND